MEKQAKYTVKVQSIKSKGQKERPYLFIPIPLAAAIGLEKGEQVQWELLSRNELHLVRPDPPKPSTKKRATPSQGFFNGIVIHSLTPMLTPMPHYEAGHRHHIALCRVIDIANALGVTPEELIKNGSGSGKKRGPAPKIQQLVERVQKLPKARQRFVTEMIEDALARAH